MKKVLLIIAFVLMGCVTTQPKVDVKVPVQQQRQLTQAEIDKLTIKAAESFTRVDIANILTLAINDIEKQGCKAEFLSERGSYIWCRCKDKTVKYYDIKPLIKKYRKLRKGVKDDTNNRKQ